MIRKSTISLSSGLAAIVVVLVCVTGQTGQRPVRDPAREVAQVLDHLHDAASKAEGLRYFSLFDRSAVFFGTDPKERWSFAEFRAYAQPHFDKGTGWTYTVDERHVFIGDGGALAWFDEKLSNEKYGTCRGTGVLLRRTGGWRIVQYNLSLPIPNDLALDVVKMIREQG